jgi:acyl dehydratase
MAAFALYCIVAAFTPLPSRLSHRAASLYFKVQMADSDPPPFLGPNEALGGVSVGDEATWERTVLQEHVEKYAEVTGDTNPLHFDKEYAESTVFGALITHGGIQSGALNALVAEKLPGPGSVFMQQTLKYSAPVRVGDVVRATGKVTKVHAKKPM